MFGFIDWIIKLYVRKDVCELFLVVGYWVIDDYEINIR